MISHDLPLAAYHARTAITPSRFGYWLERKSDRRYFLERVEKSIPVASSDESEAFVIGQALEDSIQRTSTEAEAVLVAANCWGKKADTIERNLKAAVALVERMKSAFDAHPLAEAIRKHGQPQVTFSYTVKGVLVQTRPDWFFPEGLDGNSDPLILNLKTTRDLSYLIGNERSSDILDLHYHIKEAFSARVVRHALAMEHDVSAADLPEVNAALFAIEKDDYECDAAWVDFAPEQIIHARRTIEAELPHMIECHASNVWPGRPAKITAPAQFWMRRDDL